MSKGEVRPDTTVVRRREPTADERSAIDLKRCGPRVVDLRSDRTSAQLRAMRVAYLELEGTHIVLRRSGVIMATVAGNVTELRRCIEHDGVRFEAELTRLTERDGVRVPVRPLRPR